MLPMFMMDAPATDLSNPLSETPVSLPLTLLGRSAEQGASAPHPTPLAATGSMLAGTWGKGVIRNEGVQV
jgi:hypothetical protein